MDALNSLIDAAKGASDSAARQQAVRAALAGSDSPNLPELERAAAAEFATLTEPSPTGYDDATVERLGVIADVVDAVRAEAASRDASARVQALSGRVGNPTLTEPAQPAQPAQPAEPAQPAQPAQPQQPEPPQPAQPVQPSEPAQPQRVGEPVTAEVVVASGGPTRAAVAQVRNTVPLGSMPVTLPGSMNTSTPFTITAAADLPGFNLGSNLNGLEGLTEAAMARFQQLYRGGGDMGGTRAGIGAINIERDERLVAETQHDYSVIDYACNESRLPGGSLIAAGTPGWCAPAEVSYDFLPPVTVDGLVDLPSVTARRGSLIYPATPLYHTIYSSTSGFNPAADVANPAVPANRFVKPVHDIPCPDTVSLSLDPVGVALKASILVERAYPESIQYFMAQALAAHAHRMNMRTVAQMEAFATAVDLTTQNNYGPGATSTMLEAIELQVEWLRYRHRLGINASMEMVAPVWMRGILRADLSKRMGGEPEMMNVTDAQLNQWLQARGVRVQWVLDWQDAFSEADQTTAIPSSTQFGGGATPPLKYPTAGKVLIYPAGTFFRARMDLITLEGGLMDSTLLTKNERILFFTEEAMKVGKRGYEAISVKFSLCASGQTGSGAWIDCATAPKVAV